MPKTVAITLPTVRSASESVTQLLPENFFTRLKWGKSDEERHGWGELSREEQNQLVKYGTQIAGIKVLQGISKLEIGRHLYEAHQILGQHYGAFTAYSRLLRFSYRHAYRLIEKYKESVGHFSEPVLMAAEHRQIDLVGKYKKAVELLPPPNRIRPEKANEYLDMVQEKYRQIRAGEAEPLDDGNEGEAIIQTEGEVAPTEEQAARLGTEFLKIHSFRSVKNDINKLRTRPQKLKFLESHIGMLMNFMGLQSTQSFEPEAVPEVYLRDAGRPTKKGLHIVEGEKIAVNS